ncbi:MAG: hypothetical protein QF570_03900 [Myxococcota bacterium]|jgi:hypothetical protein|nr:hypothetical protein [Myxococcota bacterium]
MHRRRLRRLWFLALLFLCPWPLPLLHDAFVPAIRYWMLGSVAATLGLLEGAAGPVFQIVLLLLGWALITTAMCWLIAFLLARASGLIPDRTALLASYSAITGLLIWALTFEPYHTPFGHAVRGGLLQVLS